jgi:photosystem II stability/assembly factor-like uncharacterized protein
MIRVLPPLIGAAVVALTLGLAACGASPTAPSRSPPVTPGRSLQPSRSPPAAPRRSLQPSPAVRPLAWSYVSMPGDSSNTVLGVSCASPVFCVAAGQSGPNAASTTLIETWDGKHWSITPSPNSGVSGLNDVACLSPANCVAVGSTGSNGQALIETWDGRRWSITPSPRQGNNISTLTAVSCAGPAFCTAVGFYETAPPPSIHVLIEMWNGIRWSVSPGPSPGSGDNSLTAVSCTSTTFCFALGSAGPARHGLIVMWNGTHWSIIAAPRPIGRSGYASLADVSCTSPAFCMAVGSYSSQSNVSLTETWNGIRWSNINNPGYTNIVADAVSCTSPAFCVGAGGNELIDTWNGTAWSFSRSPGSGGANGLTGVSCASPSFCTIVGFYSTAAPLAEIGRPARPSTAPGHS